MFRRFLKRLLSPILIVVAALFMFVEEWLWVHLQRLMAWFGRLPGIRGLERRITGLPPYPAMILFIVPGLLLLPVKIGALFLIGHGFPLTGIGVIAAAKILGTAIVARLFALCRPALLTVTWFAKTYEWIIRVKSRLYSRIKAMAFWQTAERIKQRVARFLNRFRGDGLRRRWAAVKRWKRWGKRRPLTTAESVPAKTSSSPAPDCE